ncbi:MAG: ATP-binding protein [Ignavibacteria bacterium]|jgi:AAA15 family ATPase/GTPase|nr:ATP-binding protein [Ignavibacteria bacterium]MCU7504407.1 ATP-binding protein [Ignavibacteria bacterium]MCU7518152.1 ATP-binding protein [Ignavibacteria bacterium]
MKLVSLTIENFRCYKEKFKIEFDDFTTLIAKNDSGKSAILDAMNVFFNDTSLDQGDISVGSASDDITITCEFTEVPQTLIIDATNVVDLKDEYLLNSNGNLVVVKVYTGGKPKPKEVYLNSLHPSIDNANDLYQLTITQLRKRAKDIGVSLDDVKETIKAEIRQKIWSSFPDLELAEQRIQLKDKDEDQKRMWDKIKSEMPLFALFKSDRESTDQDNEAQDPMKVAIKEALESQRHDLDKIIQNVKEKVEKVSKATVDKLKEMDPDLASELNPKVLDSAWDKIFKVSLTDETQVPVNKRGSGVRRLILINFFRAKAEQQAIERNSPGIIYAIEEPETSQHPTNQVMLLESLFELVHNSNCQVIISTHTPTLARLIPSSSIRYIEKTADKKRILHKDDDETIKRIIKDLGILADHDVKLFLCVEGPNDINFFKEISKVLAQTEPDIPNLEDLENAGSVIFIPFGGSNLALWTSRLKGFNRPEIHIYDRDTIPPKEPKYKKNADETNLRDNCEAYILSKLEIENYLHPTAVQRVRPEVVIAFGDFDDVPIMAAQKLLENSDSPNSWDSLDDENKKKKESACKKWLNALAVKHMTPELLSIRDPQDELRNILRRVNEFVQRPMVINTVKAEIES